MTAKHEIQSSAKRERPLRLSAGTVVFCLMSALGFFLLLLQAERAIAAMREALSLCAKTVIPSLFPFMVVSELIVRSGVATGIGRLCAPLFRRTLGIGGAGASAVILGTLCGFPIGAKSAVGLYEAEQISRAELCHLLCFCNQPSSAFVISAVGIALFGSHRFGLLLYGITLTSALLIGILCRFLIPKVDSPTPKSAATNAVSPSTISRFTDAIAGSARSMLSVCAFVCFFATLVACLEGLPALQNLPSPLSALLVGFFELTGGVARAAACDSTALAMYACAWCLGWSGLSVHFQVMCLCDRTGVSFRPYFAAKTAQALLNVVLLYAVMQIGFPDLDAMQVTRPILLQEAKTAWPLWVALLGLGLTISLLSWRRNTKKAAKSVKNSPTESPNGD